MKKRKKSKTPPRSQSFVATIASRSRYAIGDGKLDDASRYNKRAGQNTASSSYLMQIFSKGLPGNEEEDP